MSLDRTHEDVTPFMRESWGVCEGRCDVCTVQSCRDGTPLCGTLGRPARDGLRRVKGCGDPVARGKRNRRSGLSKQSTARKRLGVAPQKFGDANEERWGDNVFANEVKSGAQIKAAVTAWLRIEAQVLANRADHGDERKPCRATLMPTGWGKDGLVMVRLSTWEELVRPALEEFYGPEVAS